MLPITRPFLTGLDGNNVPDDPQGMADIMEHTRTNVGW